VVDLQAAVHDHLQAGGLAVASHLFVSQTLL
jgi:hypothetical protein